MFVCRKDSELAPKKACTNETRNLSLQKVELDDDEERNEVLTNLHFLLPLHLSGGRGRGVDRRGHILPKRLKAFKNNNFCQMDKT